MGSRMTWPEIRQRGEFRGRWVALDNCTYDTRTAQPVEGSVVDCDEDLVELCNRMQAGESRHCAILFCDEPTPPPSSVTMRTGEPMVAPRGRATKMSH